MIRTGAVLAAVKNK